ncbi:MAG: threonine synthase, partial [Candidatus Sedimenticola endophacoides]
MRYISTRGGVEPVSFADAVMMGLATDGGLLLPESFPEVDAATLRRWAGLPFQELAVEVMLPYVGGDIRREELEELVTRSYAAFSHPEVTPVVQAGER